MNPNIPNVSVHITINPNSTQFLEINTVSGWLYLDEKPGINIPSAAGELLFTGQTLNNLKLMNVSLQTSHFYVAMRI